MTETRYLTTAHLMVIAERALGESPAVRDSGLIAAAAQRPAAGMFGGDFYPTVLDKAATLFHSIARFHPLVDGNKRFAWLATFTFITINGGYVIASNDEAFDLTMAVAGGQLAEVADIAKALSPLVRLPDTD
ncbi:MAG: type II toxin-antitoxin system death-on-curing family toxin [Actinocatenispora sp.]